MGGAPAPASSADGGVVSMDGSPSTTDCDLSCLPMPSSCLLDGAPAPVSSGDGDAAVPTERFLSVTDSHLSSPFLSSPHLTSPLLSSPLLSSPLLPSSPLLSSPHLSSPLLASSDPLDGALALSTDSDCGALSTDSDCGALSTDSDGGPLSTDSDGGPLSTDSDCGALSTDSDGGPLSTEETASRTDYNLSFPSVVCNQDTTASELFNGHLQKGNLIIIDHGRDTQDPEQLKASLFN